jgi:hypothetical protein
MSLGNPRRFVLMTAIAGIGADVVGILVTGSTGNSPAPAVVERELVLEGGAGPRGRRMALGAGGAKLRFMDLGFHMASHTALGRSLEDVVGVARGTIHLGVLTRQLERGQIVVEAAHGREVLPRGRRMTLDATGTEASLMGLRLGVAGHAALRCALEGVVDVAGLAIHLAVLTRQLERGQVVVE